MRGELPLEGLVAGLLFVLMMEVIHNLSMHCLGMHEPDEENVFLFERGGACK